MSDPRRGPSIPTPAAHRLAQKSRIGQFSVFGFLGFCIVFGTVATLLDTDAPKRTQAQEAPPSDWPYDDDTPTWFYTDNNPSDSPPPSRPPPPPNSPIQTPQSDTMPLDHFNRRFHHRTPWILQRVATTTQAQANASDRQAVAQQRVEARQTRQESQKNQQVAAQRRLAEIERFTDSRRMASEGMKAEAKTPRGRGMERLDVDGPRQRSMSTASDYSASSYDSF